jgi:DNA-binding NtrC family response regulator
VRELENAIERAVILSDGGQLTPDLLAIDGPRPAGAGMDGEEAGGSGALTEYFRRFVLEHQGHLSETEIARRLGISRKALWEKRARLGIPRSKLPA